MLKLFIKHIDDVSLYKSENIIIYKRSSVHLHTPIMIFGERDILKLYQSGNITLIYDKYTFDENKCSDIGITVDEKYFFVFENSGDIVVMPKSSCIDFKHLCDLLQNTIYSKYCDEITNLDNSLFINIITM